MVSPGFAGVVAPGKRLVGPSRLAVASACRAAMYLSKLKMIKAGVSGCICTVAELLAAPFSVTCTLTGPVVESTGTSALICVGLTNDGKASWPLILTLVPSTLVGSWLPLKSLPAHSRVLVARPVPLILTKPLGEIAAFKFSASITSLMVGPAPLRVVGVRVREVV